MNKKEAFDEINRTQDEYIEELISLITNPDYEVMKAINFTSPTGTGKTKMMAKLINRFPDCYFIITTLSRGQLHLQVRDDLSKDCAQNNFYVYGSADYKINSKLDANDIIGRIPPNTRCIWLRDEGHIKTNRFDELLKDRCYKVINFSATNEHSDIKCNFTNTMMLRTVNQSCGTPEDAVNKLLEVKEIHKDIQGYNPCAIFRCVGNDTKLYNHIKRLCKKHNLKYIDLIDTTPDVTIAELCKDDNEYDIIINKFKITEGINIKRAHILYMDNKPNNNATTIQVIGRCRRNALLYRDDIDILSPQNSKLLEKTRECYVFYNVDKMKIDSDENGELQYAFCDYISCEELKPNTTIEVVDGQLQNGLHIIELLGQTGTFTISRDEKLGFNIIEPLTPFYDIKNIQSENYIYYARTVNDVIKRNEVWRIKTENIKYFPIKTTRDFFSYSKSKWLIEKCNPYYDIEQWVYLPKDSYTIFPGAENIIKIKHDYKGRSYVDYSPFFEQVTEDELSVLRRCPSIAYYSIGGPDGFEEKKLTPEILNNSYSQKSYIKTINDKESAIIGVDMMKMVDDNQWVESKAISNKVGSYNKLNRFLSQKYLKELSQANLQTFSGKNNLGLNSKCNSCIGYCVEYYSKYLLYGEEFLSGYIEQAQKESHTSSKNKGIIIRACMLKYKQMMTIAFGSKVAKLIKTISVEQLIRDDYSAFVNIVVKLGTRTAEYIKKTLYFNCEPTNNIDPNLSIRHITGLADFITEDTILDVKVKNSIGDKEVRQVLAYHYLSTKRSDLHIKRVIVYDATSGKAVTIDISQGNIVQ